jgi:hypothetical protein
LLVTAVLVTAVLVTAVLVTAVVRPLIHHDPNDLVLASGQPLIIARPGQGRIRVLPNRQKGVPDRTLDT